MTHLRTLLAAPLLPLAVLASMPTSAATLTLDQAGKVLGARDVLVGGLRYDVSFSDGSCATLYGGCDDESDFSFHTDAQARDASLALNDQVFNAFAGVDLDPTLIRGCESSGYWYLGQRLANCAVTTPFALLPNDNVKNFQVFNDTRDAYDLVPAANNNFVVNRTTDLSGGSWPGSTTTFAVWQLASPVSQNVPEPASAALALLALAAAGAAHGHRRSRD